MKKLLLSICLFIFLLPYFLSAQTVLIDYDFNNYNGEVDSIPPGWTFSWNNTNTTSGSYYSSTQFSGNSGPNAYKFGLNNVTVTTPLFQEADTVSFWIKGSSNIDVISTLIVVETVNGTDWDTISKMNGLPTTGENIKFKVNYNSIQLKFVYQKSTGNLAFDDFQLIQVKQATADFGTQNICIGDTAVFTDLSSTAGNSTITDWLWDFGNSLTSTDQNPKHLYAVPGTYNVKLVVTDDLMNKDSITQQLDVYERPVADFGQSATVLCQNLELALTNNSVDPTDGTINTWSWEFNDGSALNTTVWSPTHYFLISGNLEIKLITYSSNLSCSDTAVSTILVNEAPQSDFSFAVNPTNQLQIDFDGTTSTGSPISYTWDFGDGNTLSGPTATNTYAMGGSYNVCLTVSDVNGCEDVYCEVVSISTTGIKSNEAKKSISVYPNPSVNGILTIDFSKYATPSATIIVNNILGSEVLKKEISTVSMRKQVIDLSAQPAGNYFINIRTEGEVITKKITISKR